MSSDEEKQAKLADLLNEAWREYRGEITGRVDAMREAIAQGAAGTLEISKRAEANSAAHKLAGALGTFGMRDASRAALQMEAMLVPDAPLGEQEIGRFHGLLQIIDEAVKLRDQAIRG
jgi:HPt (histidine-containing phosphotransfer) domain-containing protein